MAGAAFGRWVNLRHEGIMRFYKPIFATVLVVVVVMAILALLTFDLCDPAL